MKMKHFCRIGLLTVLGLIAVGKVYAQEVSIIHIDELKKRIDAQTDTLYIVNFWATWCAPCVKELPVLDSIQTRYATQKVKVLLVSLDFVEDYQSKLLPFLKKKKIQSSVLLLNESNANYFVPILDKTWTGAIPATLICNQARGVHLFWEKKVTFKLLQSKLEPLLSTKNKKE
jgi:thiol-disulfide isomerase/thioredoxin